MDVLGGLKTNIHCECLDGQTDQWTVNDVIALSKELQELGKNVAREYPNSIFCANLVKEMGLVC